MGSVGGTGFIMTVLRRQDMKSSLDYFFNPKSIAVIGASNNPQKPGHVIVKNLIEMSYPGKIFPVNKIETEILGQKAYSDISKIEDSVELVVLISRSDMIYEIMEDLDVRMKKKNDVKAIVCASAGFAEIKDEEGAGRQEALMATAKKYGIRVMGPNCIGVIDNKNRVDTTFVETLMPKESKGKPGGISFISQSGATAASILMIGASLPSPMRYNKFVSIGNMADVDFIELLEYMEQDENTRVIGLYMEGYPDARRLVETMGRISLKKPVVVLKVGKTERGAAAANSHTGSLVGADRVYDSAFRQYGIIRVKSIDELIDTMRAFDALPLPRGNRLFLYTQAGGPGIYCMDTLNDYDFIEFPVIGDVAKAKLKDMLLPMATICSPEGYADITASATVRHHVDGLKVILDEDNVDSAVLVTVVPNFLPREELGNELKKYIMSQKQKPVFPCIMAGNYVRSSRVILEEAGIPTFDTPDRAARAAANMTRYSMFLKKRGRAYDQDIK
ncbi:hypothetical protein DXT63_12530 [Thermoanaerobacteraceae bacterium SP2]|nr:hypothetical protein DXT63_12530 [Thermoanaerobacteraceae bacterium SP2]